MIDKVLILGASGFIGAFLAEEAIKRGMDVYAGIRKTSNTKYLKNPKINLVYPKLHDEQSLVNFFSKYKFDYIIHNIGLTKAKNQQQYDAVNYGLVKKVVRALENQHQLKKYIFISSLAAYGPGEFSKTGVVSENDIPHPVTFYGKSKLKAELFLKTQTHLPYNIIRPTAVYGPREKDFLSLYKTVKSGFSITIGKSDQQLSFIYVTDLVRAVFEVAEKASIHKNYFVAHPKAYTGKQLNEIVSSILDNKTISFNISPSLLRIIGRISEIFSTFTRNYPTVNQEKVNELECQSWLCDLESLRHEVGFVAQVSLEEGMRNTILWNLEKSFL